MRRKKAGLTYKPGGTMKKFQKCLTSPVLLSLFVLATLSVAGYAQDADKTTQVQTQNNAVQVPSGQKVNIEGVILESRPDGISVRSSGGAIYNVTAANGTEIKEKKSNPFRGAKSYSKLDLVPGLQVEIKGVGDTSGSVAAREIRFKNDDFKVAQTMDTRVVPVENRLRETQTRLGETEQNAQRLSGQVQELSAVSNAARGGAKAAQDTADNAMNTANNARTLADNARAGVRAANERITSLDNYDVKQTTTVHFRPGSAVLSKEDKSELERLAEQTKDEKGYLIEVAGFASSDGDEAFNRRLSQKRADAVIHYMAENYSIPMRRFVSPMGYGEKQPVADNHSRAGRKENRRVEVRILVSKGLAAPVEGDKSTGASMPTSNQQQ
jgi:OmpA-OmpF porin, OOP family